MFECRRDDPHMTALEAPRGKTVHLQELLTVFKVVVDNIVDIINFDQNTVWCHWK